MEHVCINCQTSFEVTFKIKKHRAGQHIGAYCGYCGTWWKWFSYADLPDKVKQDLNDGQLEVVEQYETTCPH